MERLQRIRLLAHAHERDRPAGHVADRQRGAATGVAVHLGQDHGIDADGLVEALGHCHGVLAGHGVDDEENVVRRHVALDRLQLV